MKFSFIVHCLLYILLAVRYFTPVFLSISFSLFFSFNSFAQSYSLEVEAYQVHPGIGGLTELDGMTTYRLYLTQLCPTDFVSAIYGNNEFPFEISAPEGLFNHLFNPGWGSFSPGFTIIFPSLLFDSFATIGFESVFFYSGGNSPDPGVSLLEDAAQPISQIFMEDGSTGACLVTLPTDSNFDYCVDLEDLLELLVLYGQCFPPQ